jgi:hypothetical protein
LVKGSEEVGHIIVDLKPRKRGLVVEAPRLIDSGTVVDGSDQRFHCSNANSLSFLSGGQEKDQVMDESISWPPATMSWAELCWTGTGICM